MVRKALVTETVKGSPPWKAISQSLASSEENQTKYQYEVRVQAHATNKALTQMKASSEQNNSGACSEILDWTYLHI